MPKHLYFPFWERIQMEKRRRLGLLFLHKYLHWLLEGHTTGMKVSRKLVNKKIQEGSSQNYLFSSIKYLVLIRTVLLQRKMMSCGDCSEFAIQKTQTVLMHIFSIFKSYFNYILSLNFLLGEVLSQRIKNAQKTFL